MHELGVVLALFDTLEQIKSEQGIDDIKKVVLDVGEMSGILPDYLKECWNAARLDSLFEKTELELNLFPAIGKCSCGEEFELMQNSRICPACHRTDYEIIDGRQFDIDKIVV